MLAKGLSSTMAVILGSLRAHTISGCPSPQMVSCLLAIWTNTLSRRRRGHGKVGLSDQHMQYCILSLWKSLTDLLRGMS